MTGTGNGIIFELFSADSLVLASDEYNYDAMETELAGTYDYGSMALNYVAATDEGDFYGVGEGTVTVTRSGSTYSITIDCEDDQGNPITGFYKGSLKVYNYEGFKSTTTFKTRMVRK